MLWSTGVSRAARDVGGAGDNMRAVPCDTEGGGQGVPAGLWRSEDANVPKGSVLGMMGISILTLAADVTSPPVFVSPCLVSVLLLSGFFGGVGAVVEDGADVEEVEEVEEVEMVVEVEEEREGLVLLPLTPLLLVTLLELVLAVVLGGSTVNSSFMSAGSSLISTVEVSFGSLGVSLASLAAA